MSLLKKAARGFISRFVSLFRATAAVVAMLGLSFGSIPLTVTAADVYWDPDLSAVSNTISGNSIGGNGTWDTTALQWWDGNVTNANWVNGNNDTAIFSYPLPANIPSFFTTTLGTPITAGQLSFLRSGYTLTGSTITLAGDAILNASYGTSTTIASNITGTSGLRVTGGGSIRLSGNNTYTGTTNIDNGTVIITSQSALGNDTSDININGSASRGFGAGSLMLDGTGGNITITRDLNLRGYGPLSDRGVSIASHGDNTISSTVTTHIGDQRNRIASSVGTLSFTGTINSSGAGGTNPQTRLTDFGGVNGVSLGNFSLTGPLTGDGGFTKQSGGSLLWDPSDTSGWSGTLRVQGSSFAQGGIRIISGNVLGTRANGGTGGVLDINGGIVEIRMDTPSLNLSNGSAANVYQRANAIFVVDNAPDGTSLVLNQTLNVGNVRFEENRDLVLEGRNGYSISFTEYLVNGGNNNTDVFNRLEGGGLATFTGDFGQANDSGNRLYRFEDDGDTLITGGFNMGASGNKILHKDGQGTLTIAGTNTTFMDKVELNRGTIAITDFDSLGSGSTDEIKLGAENAGSTSNGTSTLQIGGTGTGTPTAAGLTTSRAIVLNGTTGDGVIRAVQTGGDRIILNGDITATGAGTKDLILSGTNTSDNIINGVISDHSAGNLTRVHKAGSGTWVLAGNNTYTGETKIDNGILKIQANTGDTSVINDASEIRFVTVGARPGPDNILNDESMGGGGTLEFAGNAGENNVETLGNLDVDDGAATVRLTPGAGGNASLVFASIDQPATASSVNFVDPVSNGGNISFNTYTGNTADPFDAAVYYNGADFALITGNATAVRAAVYGDGLGGAGSDLGFFNATAALSAGNHNNVTADFTEGAAIAIDSLRIDGSTANTLTLGGLTTIQLEGAAGDRGGIILTGGNATITGGTLTTGGVGDFVVRVDGASNTLTLDTALNNASDGGFNKSGEGTLLLTKVLANVGTNAINEGTVRLGVGGSLANRNMELRHGATLDLNGQDEIFRAFNGGGNIVNTSGGNSTLSIGNGNQAGTHSGTISGNISLIKQGNQELTIDGLNTYSGVTTVESTGSIVVSNIADIGVASGIGTGDATSDATNRASLIFTGASATNDFSGISYDGWNAVSTDRLFTFGGTAANSGASIFADGFNKSSLIFRNTAALGFGAGTDQVDQTLRLSGGSTGDNVFMPQITDNPAGIGGNGTTSVFKSEGGVWTLGNTNNTYTGTTTINAGRLIAVDGQSLPDLSGLLIDNGQLLSTGTFTRTLVGTLSGNAGEVAFGATGGNSGFGAAEGDLTVTLGGVGTPQSLTWGTDFMPVGNVMRLNNLESNGVVDFTNDINLGGTTRTINVSSNAHTALDYAVLSGNLSGTAGLTLNAGGMLYLKGDNSYTGATTITNGELVVNSLGNSSSGPATSSVGATANANLLANAVRLLGTGNNPATLVYNGAGEVSDRYIRIQANGGNANRTGRIYANGTGALILTNVVNESTAASKLLFLRGNSAAENMITSVIADAGGTFGVTIDGSANWTLSGNNTYTGITSLNAGLAGAGHDNAFGTGTISLNNGLLFANGGDRTLSNNLEIDNNTTIGYVGEHSITFTDLTVTKLGNTNWGINNAIDNTNGDSLTFLGSIAADALSANRNFTINGVGDTNINGNITTSTANAINLVKAGSGTLTISGTANDFNAGLVTMDNGTLKAGAAEVITSGAGNVTGILFDPESTDIATFDLNGFDQTINALTTQGEGQSIIDNSAATDATFTFGAADSTIAINNQTTTTTFTDSGSGKLSLVKAGNTSTTFDSDTVLTHSGNTSVTGGSLTVQVALQETTGLSVTGTGSALNLEGGITTPGNITSVTVDTGGSLNLVDGVGSKFSGLTTLALGAGGNVTIGLEAGGAANANTDEFTLAGAASTGNTVTVNLTDLGLASNTTYTLFNATSGLGFGTGTTYTLGTTPGGFGGNFTLSGNDTIVQITTGVLASGNLFWDGATDNTWNGALNNFSTDKGGTLAAGDKPGAGNKIFFTSDGVAGTDLTTTLEENFRVDSVTFESSATTQGNVTIASGVDPTARLDIAPASSADGLTISSGGPTNVTISAPLVTGADQTWNVVDAASTLTIGGGLLGEADVAVSGNGTVTVSAAADGAYNPGGTADFTVTNGTLALTNGDGLGTAAGGNAANVIIGVGGNFIANAGTPDVTIDLAGGQLGRLGVNARTYDGNITVSADSTINLRDDNSAVVTVAGDNITLNGDITGTNKLSVESQQNTGANNVSGSLILAGNLAGYSGDLDLNGGTVIYRNQSPGQIQASGNINIVEGKIEFEGAGGGANDYTVTRNIAITDAGEIDVDRTSGTGDFTVTFANPISVARNATGTGLLLEGITGSKGIILGGITAVAGSTADMTVNGGEWTFSGNTVSLQDDLTVGAPDAILNLATTGVLAFGGTTGAGIRAHNGGTINVLADNVAAADDIGQLLIGSQGNGLGTFNLGAFDLEVLRLDVGSASSLRFGQVTGTTGVLTAGDFNYFEGNITANLASDTNTSADKRGLGTLTLSGNNTGLTHTADTLLRQGTLVLDYSTDINSKISNAGAAELSMRGGNLTLNGHASSAVTQNAQDLRIVDNNGYNVIDVNNLGGNIALVFDAMVRNNNTGTVRFELPTGAQTNTNGITTSTSTVNGILDSASDDAYATVFDGTDTFFATINGNNIVGLNSTLNNDVTTWVTDSHVTDDDSLYTGTVTSAAVNSLRLNGAGGSDITIAAGGVLGIRTGGILVTDKVTGTSSISGGTLEAGGNEIIVHQDSGQTLTISSGIHNNNSLTKSGAGTLSLTGSERTYTGITAINAGTLITNGSLSSFSRLAIAAHRDARLELTADETILDLIGGLEDGASGTGVIDVNGNTLEILNNGGANRTYAGRFEGSGVIETSTGDRNLSLTGRSDTFTGSFEIADNALIVDVRGRARLATSWTINQGGSLTLEKRGNTREGTMVGNNAAVVLNSADGTRFNSTIVRGFHIDTDQASNNGENIGVLTANSGANYISIDARTAGDDPNLSIENLIRNNAATLNVRATNLGTTNGQRGRVLIDNGNELAFNATEIGGGGAAGSTNISIVPWIIGENVGTAITAATNMGNSLVRYDNTLGLVALDFATEYSVLSGAAADDNVRESLGADLTGLTTQTVNALVVDNTAAVGLNVSGTGAGQSLTNTSGAFLFTVSGGAASTAYDTTLDGFDSGVATSNGEYLFHVVNPSGATTTSTLTAAVASNLTSGANITKSGRGTLILSGNNTAVGATTTTINEGTLLLSDLNNIGGTTGGLTFGGGTLALAANATNADLSSRSITWLANNSTIDQGANDLTFANSLGTGSGGFSKVGSGNLTLNATSTRSGDSFLTEGTVTLGATNALGIGDIEVSGGSTLDIGASNVSTGLFSISGTGSTISGTTGVITATEAYYINVTGSTTISAILGGSVGLFKDSAAGFGGLTLTGNNTYSGQTIFKRGTLTYNSLTSVGGGASALGAVTTIEEGTIRLGTSGITTAFRYIGSGNVTSDRIIAIDTETHAAPLTTGLTIENDSANNSDLNLGVVRNEAYGEKALNLQGSSTGAASVDAIRDDVGTLNVRKLESNTWTIDGDSNYKGVTSVVAGTLLINGDNTAATGAVTVSTGATLGGNGTIGGATTVNAGGTLSAGASLGAAGLGETLNFASDLTQATGSSITWDLMSNSTSTGDKFAIAGDLSFGTDTTIDIVFGAGTSFDGETFWQNTQEWDVWDYSGTISPPTFNAGNFTLNVTSNGSGTAPTNAAFVVRDFGGAIQIHYATPIPEPGTYGIFGLGLALFAWNARRRRRKAAASDEVVSD